MVQKQHDEKLIPRLLEMLLRNPIPIYGDGKNIRETIMY